MVMEMDLDPHNDNNNNETPPDQTIQARYWLIFINQVKSPAFTSNPVDPIEVVIYDTCTQSYISSECFRSSAKVRLTVLNDELWVNKGENWSRSEFNQSVLREREGKGAVLKDHSLTILLENGLITFKNIIFNDNSSWTRSGFRLGVVVEGDGEEGYLNGERVREGVSKAFRVQDRHGKASQKPDVLKLTHEVQNLKKVGKDRASLLQRNNIKTVEDFLRWYNNNELELHKILGIKSESDKRWKSMIEHAMQCANEFYAKYNILKSSMSNSGYVGPLSPHMIAKIKIVFKFITVLAGPRSCARIVPPAIYKPMENTSQPQQDLVHLNGRPLVVGSGSSEPNSFENDIIKADMLAIYGQLEAFCASLMNELNEPVSTASGEHIVETQPALFHETNVSPLEQDLTWMNTLQDQFSNESEALAHLMGMNTSLYTNDGPRGVGSGSSEPNPYVNDIIEGALYSYFPSLFLNPLYVYLTELRFIRVRSESAIYKQFSAICGNFSTNVPNEHILTASAEHIVETQQVLFHETNHGNVEIGNILNGDSVQLTNGGGFPQLDPNGRSGCSR